MAAPLVGCLGHHPLQGSQPASLANCFPALYASPWPEMLNCEQNTSCSDQRHGFRRMQTGTAFPLLCRDPTSAQKCRWLCDDLALGPQTVGNARIARETGGARETEVPAGFWCTLPTLWLGRVLGDTRAEFTLSRTSPSATNSRGFLS